MDSVEVRAAAVQAAAKILSDAKWESDKAPKVVVAYAKVLEQYILTGR